MYENQGKTRSRRPPNLNGYARKSNCTSKRIGMDGQGKEVSKSGRLPDGEPVPTGKEKEEREEREEEVNRQRRLVRSAGSKRLYINFSHLPQPLLSV